jgi:hypothetical protein
MANDSRKIKHGEHLTTVDSFVGGFRPVAEQQAWYEAKALQRKNEADEIERRRKAREAAAAKLNQS